MSGHLSSVTMKHDKFKTLAEANAFRKEKEQGRAAGRIYVKDENGSFVVYYEAEDE